MLFWLVAGGCSTSAAGYWLMLAGGYDYWSPQLPAPHSLGETGLSLADLGQMVAALLMFVGWIVFSGLLSRARRQIPTQWRHSSGGVWLWWFVPVASFWKPRDVVLEVAMAARPHESALSKALVDRWWVAFLTFILANYLGWLEFRPLYLAISASIVGGASAVAARWAGGLVDLIASPQSTHETAAVAEWVPVGSRLPTVPGWYDDPSNVATYQAYWDGGRWTGATRPDPRLFPSLAFPLLERDRLRVWLIVLGVVVTLGLLLYLGFAAGGGGGFGADSRLA